MLKGMQARQVKQLYRRHSYKQVIQCLLPTAICNGMILSLKTPMVVFGASSVRLRGWHEIRKRSDFKGVRFYTKDRKAEKNQSGNITRARWVSFYVL